MNKIVRTFKISREIIEKFDEMCKLNGIKKYKACEQALILWIKSQNEKE